MYKNVSRVYFNISRLMCAKFCSECATCIKQKSHAKKCRACHRSILTVGFGSRGQVDLVDLQSSEFGGMKWLLTYCDHGTKYAATCPLPNKQVRSPSLGLSSFHHYLDIEIPCAGFNYCEGPLGYIQVYWTPGYSAT